MDLSNKANKTIIELLKILVGNSNQFYGPTQINNLGSKNSNLADKLTATEAMEMLQKGGQKSLMEDLDYLNQIKQEMDKLNLPEINARLMYRKDEVDPALLVGLGPNKGKVMSTEIIEVKDEAEFVK